MKCPALGSIVLVDNFVSLITDKGWFILAHLDGRTVTRGIAQTCGSHDLTQEWPENTQVICNLIDDKIDWKQLVERTKK